MRTELTQREYAALREVGVDRIEIAEAVRQIVVARVNEAKAEALRDAAAALPIWEGVNEVQVYGWLIDHAGRYTRDGGDS